MQGRKLGGEEGMLKVNKCVGWQAEAGMAGRLAERCVPESTS